MGERKSKGKATVDEFSSTRQGVGGGAQVLGNPLCFQQIFWRCFASRYSFLMLIAGQLMPDHLEGFLCIAKCDLRNTHTASNLPAAFGFDWRTNCFIFVQHQTTQQAGGNDVVGQARPSHAKSMNAQTERSKKQAAPQRGKGKEGLLEGNFENSIYLLYQEWVCTGSD